MKKKLLSVVLVVLLMGQCYGEDKETVLEEASEWAKIMAETFAATITYGVLHGEVAAHACPEYFTKGFNRKKVENWSGPVGKRLKKMLLNIKSPVALGLAWGVLATWRAGLLLGLPVTLSARVGTWPKLDAKDLIKPMAATLGGVGAVSLGAGLKGYHWSKNVPTFDEMKKLTEKLADEVGWEEIPNRRDMEWYDKALHRLKELWFGEFDKERTVVLPSRPLWQKGEVSGVSEKDMKKLKEVEKLLWSKYHHILRKKARGASEGSLDAFVANLYACEASRIAGGVAGGVILPLWILWKRYMLEKERQAESFDEKQESHSWKMLDF